jgi:hypothetical protein
MASAGTAVAAPTAAVATSPMALAPKPDTKSDTPSEQPVLSLYEHLRDVRIKIAKYEKLINGMVIPKDTHPSEVAATMVSAMLNVEAATRACLAECYRKENLLIERVFPKVEPSAPVSGGAVKPVPHIWELKWFKCRVETDGRALVMDDTKYRILGVEVRNYRGEPGAWISIEESDARYDKVAHVFSDLALHQPFEAFASLFEYTKEKDGADRTVLRIFDVRALPK